jgi:hypothetical protein
MSEHTPGPWTTYQPHGHVLVTSERRSDNLCRLLGSPEWDWSELKANARLIAAAPELLEAAKQALDALNKHEGIPSEASDKLASAIAKAEGREDA